METTAQEQYEKNMKEIKGKMALITAALQAHETGANKNGMDWAAVGDLRGVIDCLDEVVEFI